MVQCWLTQGHGPDEKFNLSCGQNDQLVHLWVLVPSCSDFHLWWRSNSTKIWAIQNSVHRPVYWYVGGDALIDFHFNIPNTLQITYSIYEIGYYGELRKEKPYSDCWGMNQMIVFMHLGVGSPHVYVYTPI